MSNPRKSIKPARSDFHDKAAPVRAMSWPATSSITTNCGSFALAARATTVAAGMPSKTAARARASAAPPRLPGAIEAATPYQSATVTADAQVPGPGPSRPTPKKVAIRLAQTGGGATEEESVARSGLVSVIARLRAGRFVRARVLDRRRDYVSPRSPPPQIEQSAAFAAEWVFSLGSFHFGLTNGAT